MWLGLYISKEIEMERKMENDTSFYRKKNQPYTKLGINSDSDSDSACFCQDNPQSKVCRLRIHLHGEVQLYPFMQACVSKLTCDPIIIPVIPCHQLFYS